MQKSRGDQPPFDMSGPALLALLGQTLKQSGGCLEVRS